jgi:hypothetical protein
VFALIVLVLVVFWIAAFGFGRWALDRAALSKSLERGRVRTASPPYDHDEIRGLPPPVARYFEAALTPGRPFIESATLVENGWMRTSPGSQLTFSAITRVTVRRPGFISEAHVKGPLGVRVIDAYAEGQGRFRLAALFGGLHLAGWKRVHDTRVLAEMARSQLQRWLAEAPWYPTALLPRAGVRWEPVDERSARATIVDGLNEASLLFRFGNDALVESVYAEARGRDVRGQLVPTPWEGRFSNPVERGGYVVPRDAAAQWIGDPAPYWSAAADVTYD